jgi:transposase
MRYPGCQKAKAFKLFDKGKRPSEIYTKVKVTKHTLYFYYQQWKKEYERKKLAVERQRRLEEEREEREREQEQAEFQKDMMASIDVQQRIRMREKYLEQMKRVLELKTQMERAANTPGNMDEVQRIGEHYTQAYDEFRRLTKTLYLDQADEDSINLVLHPKQSR